MRTAPVDQRERVCERESVCEREGERECVTESARRPEGARRTVCTLQGHRVPRAPRTPASTWERAPTRSLTQKTTGETFEPELG